MEVPLLALPVDIVDATSLSIGTLDDVKERVQVRASSEDSSSAQPTGLGWDGRGPTLRLV